MLRMVCHKILLLIFLKTSKDLYGLLSKVDAIKSRCVRFNGKRFRVFKAIEGFTSISEWMDYVNVKIGK